MKELLEAITKEGFTVIFKTGDPTGEGNNVLVVRLEKAKPDGTGKNTIEHPVADKEIEIASRECAIDFIGFFEPENNLRLPGQPEFIPDGDETV